MEIEKVLKSIAQDRSRTNLLRKYEQQLIAFLVQRIPAWINSNMLTAFGFLGSIVVFGSFMLATYFSKYFLLFGVLGFVMNWFGDSLDGRLAYYRNKPRKLYGFALDISIDWMTIILIGSGYIVYSEGIWELLGYAFVVMYGWEMIIALMRYKITSKYSIDSGKFGPTEVRIIICAILVAEVFLPGSLRFSALAISVFLLIAIVVDTRKLLRIADEMDHSKNQQ